MTGVLPPVASLLAHFPAPLPAGMDFSALLAEGIRYCQQMSGSAWTDYNEHDPGLTILEQLVYALTDLSMRSRYRVADMLAGPDGLLPHETLFTGDRILCCEPLTADDYRRFLYDRVVGLKNVWLEPVADSPGLFRALIEKFRWSDDDVLCADVRRLLRQHRNLCEDVVSVKVLKRQPVSLAGRITLAPGADADAVMARILLEMELGLIPGPDSETIDARVAAGESWDTIYEGPALSYGLHDDELIPAIPLTLSLQQIAMIVQPVAGVAHLGGLAFADAPSGTDVISLEPDSVPCIEFLRTTAPGSVTGVQWPFSLDDHDGRAMTLSPARVTRYFEQFEAALKSQETAVKLLTQTLSYRQLPKAQVPTTGVTPVAADTDANGSLVSAASAGYVSIQHQFPATYGLGRYGVHNDLNWQPEKDHARASQPDKTTRAENNQLRSAQVRQLRAYLLLFEQVLANDFSQLAQAGKLFSLGPPLPHRQNPHTRSVEHEAATYFCASLAGNEPADPPKTVELLSGCLRNEQTAQTGLWSCQTVLLDPGSQLVLRGLTSTDAETAASQLPVLGRLCTDITRYVIEYRTPDGDQSHFHRVASATSFSAGQGSQTYNGNHGRELPIAAGFNVFLLDQHGQSLLAGPLHCTERGLDHARGMVQKMVVRLQQIALTRDGLTHCLRLQRRGAMGMIIGDAAGHGLLSAHWPGVLEQRTAVAEDILKLCCDPAHYRQTGNAQQGWYCELLDRHGHVVAEGVARHDSPAASLHATQRLAQLARQISNGSVAYLRHVRLLPAHGDQTAESGSQTKSDDASRIAAYQQSLRHLMMQFSESHDRRGRFLNHLLARFDEQFEDDTLQRIDPRPATGQHNLQGTPAQHTFADDLNSWKTSFLRAMPQASARRGSGFDYGLKTAQPLPFGSGLEHRLYSLLGIGGPHAFARYPRSRRMLTAGRRQGSASAPDTSVPEQAFASEFYFRSTNEAIFAALLRYGTDLRRFSIRAAADNLFELLFVLPEELPYIILSHPQRDHLERHRDALISWLDDDAQAALHIYEDEGFSLVEHILLRPASPDPAADFYTGRFSVIFPDWPVRFKTRDFRILAARMVDDNCPVHLVAECHWLDFAQMQQFETLYADWAAEKYGQVQRGEQPTSGPVTALVDHKARALADFLQALPVPAIF